MRAIIVANGVLGDPDRLSVRLDRWRGARVIAVDGGLRHCQSLGLIPQALIGDFDSLDLVDLAKPGDPPVERVRSPAEKDETDLELALGYARQQGFRELVILGALGGRLDMTVANLLLLADPRFGDLDIQLWSTDQAAWLLRPPGGEIRGQPGDGLSLIPLGSDVEAVRTEGLRYPLRNEALRFGAARGVSNVLTGDRAAVRFRSGLLLVVHTHAAPQGSGPG